MLDPFPAPPPSITRLVEPLASILSLPTLPLHAHEILFAFSLYQLINAYLSPWLSARLFPTTYPQLNRRTRINWDVHVVSLVQSVLVNTLALWVIWHDDERAAADWRGRIWGYTGAAGLVQGFAAGYFLWDLMITTRYVAIFGWGMLAHAVCALIVFGFGFRPFVNYYGPVFILYELSSPFLNIHWFFDKLHMTGSKPQLVNGLVLLSVFFSCRLVWGTCQTYHVFQDVWKAMMTQDAASCSPASGAFSKLDETATAVVANTTLHQSGSASAELMRFAGPQIVPWWLAIMYLSSNVVLTGLNFFWFKKMVDAVRKRFTPGGSGGAGAGETKEGKLLQEKKKKKGGRVVGDDDAGADASSHTNNNNASVKVAVHTDADGRNHRVTEIEGITMLERTENEQPQQQQRRRRRYA